MSERIQDPRERSWARVHVVCVFLLLVFHVYEPVNVYLWETVKTSYLAIGTPVLIAFYYYFRRLNGGPELRLMTFYALWFYITRVLNGDLWLREELGLVREMAVCAVILPVGLLLNGDGRRSFLNWVSALIGGFYSVLGVLGLYASFTKHYLYNPVTGTSVAGLVPNSFPGQIGIIDLNVNISSLLFFLMFFLMLFQFFACRNKLWRIPIVLAAAVDYLLLVFAYSRNIMITFSLCLAMALVLIARTYLPVKGRARQAAQVLVILALAAPLCYKSFDLTRQIYVRIEQRLPAEESAPEAAPAPSPADAPAETADPEQPEAVPAANVDTRDLGESLSTLSGRTDIFRGELITIQQEPIRLLRGSLYDHVMDIVNQNIRWPHLHLHNFLLQTLGLTGLVGFALVLAFCVLLVLRMVRVFFSPDPRLSLPERLLTVPVSGTLLYGMLEIPAFGQVDVRSYLFFALTGIFLGVSYELFPPRHEKPVLLKNRAPSRRRGRIS